MPLRFSPDKADQAIAAVLRYGAFLSTLVMAVGICMMLARGSMIPMESGHRIQLGSLFTGVLRARPTAIIELGILTLLLTPIARIVTAIITFALERDGKYVLVSLGVLAVVLLSISFAIGA
jgi:uncharacterized membrane protein